MGEISTEYLSATEFDNFCDFLVDGLTTRQAADKLGKDRVNILKWLNRHSSEDQRNQYARALELSADSLIEDGLEIVDDSSKDEIEGKFGVVLNKEFVERSKLKSEYRKWMAGKRHSKKYGDSLKLQGDKENPIEVNINALTESERAAQVAALLDKARERAAKQDSGSTNIVGTVSGTTDGSTEQQS